MFSYCSTLVMNRVFKKWNNFLKVPANRWQRLDLNPDVLDAETHCLDHHTTPNQRQGNLPVTGQEIRWQAHAQWGECQEQPGAGFLSSHLSQLLYSWCEFSVSCRTSWLSHSLQHCSYFHSFSAYSLSAEDVLPNDLQPEHVPNRSALP